MLLILKEEPQFDPVFSERLSNMNLTENSVELRFFLKIEQHEPH
jgi:hypothetical protein